MKVLLTFHLLFYFLFATESLQFTKEEKNYIESNPVVTIGMLDSYLPFSFIHNNQNIGFTHDLLELISQNSGLQFKKVSGTWPELFTQFKEEKLDIISEISYKLERESFTEFTQPYYEVPLGIFTYGTYEYKGIDSLKNKKVAIIKDSFVRSVLEKIDGIQIVEFNSNEEKFYALLNKKVDVVLSSAISILQIESLIFKDIKLSGYFKHKEIDSEDLRFGIQKNNQLLASIIAKSLEKVEYAQMMQLKQKWILKSSFDQGSLKITLTEDEKEFIKKHPVINVSNELDWPPFDFAINQQPQGYSIDLLNLLALKVGFEINYINGYSWNELVKMFQEGKIDLLHSLNKTEDREKMGLFTNSYIRYKTHFIQRADTLKINSLKDLEDKTVAVGKGWATDEFLSKSYPKINLLRVKGTEDILKAVSSGAADVAIENNMIVKYLIKKKNFTNLFIGAWVKEYDKSGGRMLHFMVQKDMQPLVDILNKAMDSLSIEEIDKLQRKWFSKDKKNSLTLEEKNFIENHPVIRFRVRPNRPPFEFDDKGKAVGIGVDYVKMSANRVGLKVEFVLNNDSKKEAYNTIENTRDKYDTLLLDVKDFQREKRFSYGDAYLSYPMMIITYKNAPYIGSIKDLFGKTVAMEKGFATTKLITRDYPEINILNVTDTQEALKMVNNEKVTAYIGNMGVANYMSVFGGMDNLKIAAPTEYGNINYSFIAPKEWPELVSLLNKGFASISPVEHAAIQQKWFSVQTIDKTNYKTIGIILFALMLVILWILWWNKQITNEKNKTKLALKNLQKVKDKLELKNKEVYNSQQFLQSVLDESPNPIIIKNYDGKFELVNQALAKLYNTDKESMIGKDDGDFIEDKQMAEFFRENIKEIMDSGESRVVYEDSIDVSTGQVEHFMSIKKPFTNIDGNRSILVIANDITEIKNLEKEKLKNQEILFSQSKVAAMGEMIGNIAHQWRQPLSVISTAATGLLMEKELGLLKDERLKNTLENINDYAQYLSTTIDTFRDYIKTEKEYKEVILQERIQLAINIVEASFKNNYITIKTNLDNFEAIKINLVVGELSEVLINLLNNSKDALKEKMVKEPWVFIEVEPKVNKVIISVEDNGGGIPRDVMPKIFDPYFTTKHQSQGTGLGLHMSYKIITESLHGQIFAQNTDNGAKFTIELPLK